ncbi:MAG TPA: hypothetical protein VMI52_09150 [Acetobacteraceae bacterium]|nr:hypothetical protein [Acetobacteraceae bacterium]
MPPQTPQVHAPEGRPTETTHQPDNTPRAETAACETTCPPRRIYTSDGCGGAMVIVFR